MMSCTCIEPLMRQLCAPADPVKQQAVYTVSIMPLILLVVVGFEYLILLIIFLQDGFTSLHFACQNGHSRVVSMLLEHGADLHLTNRVSAATQTSL